MTWPSAFTQRAGIQYPIIQAPMLGVTTPEMVAAVANYGGLGSLPVGGLSPEVTQQLIRKTKSLTTKPFAVNLFAHSVPDYAEETLEPMRQLLLKLAHQRGYELHEADLHNFRLYTYHDQVEVLLEENIPIISFTFGNLEAKIVAQFKAKGCLLIGTATCPAEATLLAENQIDMIVAQGIEAGGHRGTFLDDIPLPQIGLFSLLPQLVDAVPVPVIAAGGISNAPTIQAAFELGAAAVQIGTAFIATTESEAIADYQKRIIHATATDTTLTRAFSGRWARGFRNELMQEIEQSGIAIPPYPFQNSLIAKLRKLAQQANDAEYTTLWAGQSAKASDFQSTADVFRDLVRQYEQRYG